MTQRDQSSNRSPFVPELNESMLRTVLQTFYRKLKGDEVLGPVFTEAIGEDWSKHIERITQFWLRATGIRRGYSARHFERAHLSHPNIHADHLPRWLRLFSETARELCPPAVADFLIGIAGKMVENLAISFAKRSACQSSPADHGRETR